MGANFQTMIVSGKKTAAEVKGEFAKAQDQDRYENGCSYSGGFGMATGLVFDDRTFATRDEAERFLDDTTVKWEDAVAVRFKEPDGTENYLIGATCAS